MQRQYSLQDFIDLFKPAKKIFHSDEKSRKNFDLRGFSTVLAYNYANSDFEELRNKFDEKAVDLIDFNADNIHIAESVDMYFTPNLFLGNQYDMSFTSRKTSNKLAWIQDIFIDIDSTDGIKDPKVAKNKLYEVLKELNIPYPSALIKTSVADDVHLQLHYLLDPLWNYDNREERVDLASLRNYYINVATAIVELLQSKLKNWKFDVARTTDATTYARLPLSYNQKTGDRVEILDINRRKERYTLQAVWIKNVIQQYYKLNKKYQKFNVDTDIDLLQHPQIKALLNGVEKGHRNYAQYAIALACKHSDISLNEAIEIVLKQNKKCKTKERESKVISITKSAYRSKFGLSAKKVAQIVTEITREEVKVDYSLYIACRDDITIFNNRCKNINVKKKDMIHRAIRKLLQLVRQGVRVLPTTRALAKLISVSQHSLRRVFADVINLIKKSANIKIDNTSHYHHRFILLDRASELLNSNNSSSINIDLLKAILEQTKLNYNMCKLLQKKSEEEITRFAEIVANSPP